MCRVAAWSNDVDIVGSEERVLDLPNTLLAAHTEFEVFLCDRVPVLVHHHDGKEKAEDAKEGAVNVVLDTDADLRREAKHENTGGDKGKAAKGNVAQRPPIVECSKDENYLGDDVDGDADDRKEELDDPESDLLCWRQPSNTLERGNGNEEANDKEEERADSDKLRWEEYEESVGAPCMACACPTHPERLWCAVFSKLEADKAVDEQAPEDGGAETDVDGREPLEEQQEVSTGDISSQSRSTHRVDTRVGGDDGRVEEDGEDFGNGVEVEEEDNLLAAWGGCVSDRQ